MTNEKVLVEVQGFEETIRGGNRHEFTHLETLFADGLMLLVRAGKDAVKQGLVCSDTEWIRRGGPGNGNRYRSGRGALLQRNK